MPNLDLVIGTVNLLRFYQLRLQVWRWRIVSSAKIATERLSRRIATMNQSRSARIFASLLAHNALLNR